MSHLCRISAVAFAVMMLGPLLSGCGKDSSSRPAPAALAPDIYEPNDDIPSSLWITLEFIETSLTIHDSSDVDYFVFFQPTDFVLLLTTDFTHSDGDLDVELLDSARNVIGASTSQSDGEFIAQELIAGTYFVRVFSPTNETNTYDLQVTGVEDQ